MFGSQVVWFLCEIELNGPMIREAIEIIKGIFRQVFSLDSKQTK